MSTPTVSNTNTTLPLRAALYIRVSSEEQAKEGYSLIAQQEKLEEYAQKNGYLLDTAHLYIDEGYSGKTENRPALTRLFTDAQQKAFDVVLVYRLDRFFRNVRLLLESVETLGQSGIGLKSITEPFDTSTPIGRYVLTNLGAVAELERAIIMERKELGTVKAAQAGKWMGGTPPYGYRINRETKKLELEPQEAAVVTMLYEWLLNEKLSLYRMQQRINTLKVPTKHDRLGKAKPTASPGWWRKQTIARLFANEVYAGTFWFRKWKRSQRAKTPENLRPKEDWVAIPTPAIVSKEQFALARTQLEANHRNSPRRMKRVYLFSKKLTCGLCRGVMVAQYQGPGSRRRTEVRFYTCHKKSREHAEIPCTQRSMVEPRIEVPIWEAITKLLLQPEAMIQEVEALQRKDDPRPALHAKQVEIERQLTQIAIKQERVVELYIEGAMDKAAFIERSRKLEREKEILAKQSVELSQALLTEEEQALKIANVKQVYDRLQVNVEAADYETKRTVIDLLIQRIVVHQDQLEVVCHLPHQFLEGEQRIPVALCPTGRVDCDAKPHMLAFAVEPLPRQDLTAMRRETNLRYGLKRNLFFPDGRLKARLGGKPQGEYALAWHLERIRDPQARERFVQIRELILSSGDYQEAFRKEYIAYIDLALYNRFLLLPVKRHIWLAIKGTDLHEEGLHSYSDGIQTFFRIGMDVSLERLKQMIQQHRYHRRESLND